MADLFHRVSIRKYQEKKVEPEKLDYILRASMAAPSACNQQPWEFYIVEDPEILEELSETTPYAKLTAKAPVAIVTAYRKECTVPEYAQIDLSICMENMWLATDEVGLGGVWMGIAPLEDRMEEVEKSSVFRKVKEHSVSLHWDIRQKREPSRIVMMKPGSIV